MGTFMNILLDIITILIIIIAGALLVVVVAELILRLLGGSSKTEDTQNESGKRVVKDDDIVVYSNKDNPGTKSDSQEKVVETIDGDKIEEIDYDKAVEEQKMLQAKQGGRVAPAPQQKEQKPVEKAPANDDLFWDDEEDEFDKFLDDVVKEVKNGSGAKEVKKQDATDDKLSQEQDKRIEEARALEEKARVAEEKAKAAEERARAAEEKARLAEENARKAVEEAEKEKDAKKAEEAAKKAEEERIKAEEKAREAEEKAREAEEQAKAAEEARREEELKKAQEDAKRAIDDATQKELEELRALKEQQQKELEEFKQMKEDFAREKEEQLELLKDNIQKAKESEIERIRQDALKEQARLEKMQDKLEEERQKLEEDKDRFEESKNDEPEQVIKETIIKDEEELNRLKYKNLMRMNNRLTRIIRDTERLQAEKEREKSRVIAERNKILKEQEEEKQKAQEKQAELDRKEREKILKQRAEEDRKQEIARKLEEAGKRAGKYKLDNKVIKVTRQIQTDNQFDDVIEEKVVAGETTNQSNILTADKAPMKPAVKPLFDKSYYEEKLQELEEELKEAEKELRMNKAEYIPLSRIHKAYSRDSEKLRKKEMQVAKQKVSLYGVNSRNVDPAKKAKLDENLQALAELKDSVQHCEEVIKKNKDRFPILEKNNQLITKQIARIQSDMTVCEKALEYYKKNN